MKVRLEVAVSQADGELERRQRVLRRFARATAMGEGDRPVDIKERVHPRWRACARR
jgi:hypothetical protein